MNEQSKDFSMMLRKAMEATALKFGVELENLIIDEKQTGGRISQTCRI